MDISRVARSLDGRMMQPSIDPGKPHAGCKYAMIPSRVPTYVEQNAEKGVIDFAANRDRDVPG